MSILRLGRLGLLSLCTTALALIGAPGVERRDAAWPRSLPSVAPARTPDLTPSEWSSIRAAYERERHAVVAVPGEPDRWQARTHHQQWIAQFDGRGFLVTPDEGAWTWGLQLVRYGVAGNEQPITAPAGVRLDGQRMTYTWDAAIDEWFVNDRRGLEHGFTLHKRPGPGAGPIVLDLDVVGDLTPRIHGDRRGIAFATPQGVTAVTYSGLTVFDGDGRTLPAHFEETDTIRLVVDDRGARYPVTIDPIAQQVYIKASNAEANDTFAIAAVSGDTMVVGAPTEDSNATGVNGDGTNNSASAAGAAYVFVRSGGAWTQQAYLKASNTGAGDDFGRVVAISGDTIVVGALEEDSSATGVGGDGSDNSASGAGAAYVFVRTSGVWTQQAYLKASNTGASDNFGWNVAVSGDTVVVAALNEDSNATGVNGDATNDSASASGAAYVFVRSNGAWSQSAYLKASNTGNDDWFGYSIAVSGTTVVVGALQEDSSATGVGGDGTNNGATSSGAAYVFVNSDGVWSQQGYLKASNTGANDWFGHDVDVSGDIVVIGARLEDSNATGVGGTQANNSASGAGAAYVFARSEGAWSQQAYLKASNTGTDDQFGFSVAVSGTIVVVGAIQEDSTATGIDGDQTSNGSSDSGAGYVFVRDGGVWVQRAYLKASNTGGIDLFGWTVAVSGLTVVAGAVGEDSNATGIGGNQANNSANNAGAVYVFTITPTAISAAISVTEDQTFSGTLGGTDPDGDAVTFSIVSNGSKGSAGITNAATGAFTYTPTANATGSDTFTFKTSDGVDDSNVATISVTIVSVNDAPTVTSIANQTPNEDTATSALGFTIGDIDGDTLAVSAASSNTAVVPNNNLALGGSGANRTITITPAANQNGSTTVTLTVNDGTVDTSTTFTVAVTAVNDAPTMTSVANQTINEDTATSALAFTIGDVEGDTLTVSAASSNTTLVPNGNLALGGSGANRTITVTPAANLSGSTTVTLTVNDGTVDTTTTFAVTVTAVNDAPTVSAISNQTINEDGATSALAFTIADVEGDALTVSAASSNTTLVPNNSLALGGAGASRTITITPAANQNGSTTVTLTVNDGTVDTSTTFTVTVTAVNDAPTMTSVANQTINEDTATSALAFTIGDVDGDTLTVSAASSNTTLVPNNNLAVGGSGANRTITVTPAANLNGSTTVTLTVNDGTVNTSSTFTVTVTAVNDAPTVSAISNQTINEDGATSALAFTTADVEGDALTVSAASSNTTLVPNNNLALGGSGANRTVTVTPAANQNGSTTVTLTVNDGTASTERTFTVTVTAVNDAPTLSAIPNTATPRNVPVTLNLTVDDLDDGAAAVTLSATSSNTILLPSSALAFGGSNANRTLTISPAADQAGTAFITATASDGASTAVRSFVLTVGTFQAFTDDPLSAAATPIRAVHITELRSRINAIRSARGLAAFSWADPSLSAGGSAIRAVHVQELRTALAEAYTAASRTPPAYTDDTIVPGTTPIKAVHIVELRSAVIALE